MGARPCGPPTALAVSGPQPRRPDPASELDRTCSAVRPSRTSAVLPPKPRAGGDIAAFTASSYTPRASKSTYSACVVVAMNRDEHWRGIPASIANSAVTFLFSDDADKGELRHSYSCRHWQLTNSSRKSFGPSIIFIFFPILICTLVYTTAYFSTTTTIINPRGKGWGTSGI